MSGREGGGLPVDEAAIRTLARILTETGLTEIELSEKDLRIRVARMPAPVQAFAGPAPVGTAAPPAPAPVEDAEHPGAVTSPMVGIAYLASEPGAPPFVPAGQAVSAGQTLMLIEAMKTFNQIKAPRAGTLTRILVSPGAPVEYGQALMIIED